MKIPGWIFGLVIKLLVIVVFNNLITEKPFDITPTSVLDDEGEDLSEHFIKTLTQTERMESVADFLKGRFKIPDPAVELKDVSIVGLTNAAYLSLFLETREIIELSAMTEKTFTEQLTHLQADLASRETNNTFLAGVTSIEDLDTFPAEEFEELFVPVWALYPYRDEGFLRRAGMTGEKYSYCQWSTEWSIDSSSVSCVVAR